MASRQYPCRRRGRCDAILGVVSVPLPTTRQVRRHSWRRVNTPANKNCLDKNVQATVARTFLSVQSVASASLPTTRQVRRHSWRRVNTPANKNCLDTNVQATGAQARRQECRRTPVASASPPTTLNLVASASPPSPAQVRRHSWRRLMMLMVSKSGALEVRRLASRECHSERSEEPRRLTPLSA